MTQWSPGTTVAGFRLERPLGAGGYGEVWFAHHLAMALGPVRMRRDVGRIQDALVAAGNASWLSENSRLELSAREGADRLARDELKGSAAAVRRLLEPR